MRRYRFRPSSSRQLGTLEENDELDNFVQFSFHRQEEDPPLVENSKVESMEE